MSIANGQARTDVSTFEPMPEADPSKLVWEDNFDKDGAPDPDKWGYDEGGHGWGNGEKQNYTSRRENSWVSNGTLKICARREDFKGNKFTSARLVTKNKGDWLCGRVEVRARLPTSRGSWPAIWMLPTDWVYGEWPKSGEIDIMEHVGYDCGRVHGTVHTDKYNHMKNTQVGKAVSLEVTDWHVYSVEWSKSAIHFGVDGRRYHKFENQGTGENAWKAWPFAHRHHLLLNVAVGGAWGGQKGIDESSFEGDGQIMEISSVKVYAAAPEDVLRPEDVPRGAPVETFVSSARVPLDITVTITNKASSRRLYAELGKNWEDQVGAGNPPSTVGLEGAWRITADGNGFRIINQHSQRSLYAKPDREWDEGVGAGSPPSAVGADGVWYIIDHGADFRIINKHSRRCLYAACGENLTKRLGAGAPHSAVGDDGVWIISRSEDVPRPAGYSGNQAPAALINSSRVPLDTDVTITNKSNSRRLYAQAGKNWEDETGAGTPPSAVGVDGVWRITADGNGFRITNQHSQRSIYAKGGNNWDDGVGAGSPPSAVGADGVWYITDHGTDFRIINQHSQRCLYAANDKNWTERLGAGAPHSAVGNDGVWVISTVG